MHLNGRRKSLCSFQVRVNSLKQFQSLNVEFLRGELICRSAEIAQRPLHTSNTCWRLAVRQRQLFHLPLHKILGSNS